MTYFPNRIRAAQNQSNTEGLEGPQGLALMDAQHDAPKVLVWQTSQAVAWKYTKDLRQPAATKGLLSTHYKLDMPDTVSVVILMCFLCTWPATPTQILAGITLRDKAGSGCEGVSHTVTLPTALSGQHCMCDVPGDLAGSGSGLAGLHPGGPPGGAASHPPWTDGLPADSAQPGSPPAHPPPACCWHGSALPGHAAT